MHAFLGLPPPRKPAAEEPPAKTGSKGSSKKRKAPEPESEAAASASKSSSKKSAASAAAASASASLKKQQPAAAAAPSAPTINDFFSRTAPTPVRKPKLLTSMFDDSDEEQEGEDEREQAAAKKQDPEQARSSSGSSLSALAAPTPAAKPQRVTEAESQPIKPKPAKRTKLQVLDDDVGDDDLLPPHDDDDDDDIDLDDDDFDLAPPVAKKKAAPPKKPAPSSTKMELDEDAAEPRANRTPTKASAPGSAAGASPARKPPVWLKQPAPPPNLGKVPPPVGKPFCLNGGKFVITGTLDSLTREAASDLIMEYGGLIRKSVSGATDYLVAGSDAGESKIEKAKKLNIKVIDEAELRRMIETNPEGQPEAPKKGSKKSTSSPARATVKKTAPADDFDDLPVSRSVKAAQPPATASRAAFLSSDSPVTSASSFTPASSVSLSSSSSSSASGPPRSTELWVDKYKPTRLSEIVGNQGHVKQIEEFLKNWDKVILGGNEKQAASAKRAILVSGPPGTGKTTACTLIPRILGFQVIELNASDMRNKASIEETVENLSSYNVFNQPGSVHSLTPAQKELQARRKAKHVIVMDEVDGMSGNADRGGVQSLINVIKKTSVPIICICNDGGDRKLQTLKKYAICLSWARTPAARIVARVKDIAAAEGLHVDTNILTKIVESTHSDIRQVLNLLQMYASNLSTGGAAGGRLDWQSGKALIDRSLKDFDTNYFSVANDFFRQVSPAEKLTWMNDRQRLYFVESAMLPMMTQSNYLECAVRLPEHTSWKLPCFDGPHAVDAIANPLLGFPGDGGLHALPANQLPFQGPGEILDAYAAAADWISEATVIQDRIMSTQDYSMMTLHAMISCVGPGYLVAGAPGRPQFASWFGKNSKQNGNLRVLQDLSHAIGLQASGNLHDVVTDYLPALRERLLQPFTRVQGAGGGDDYDPDRDDGRAGLSLDEAADQVSRLLNDYNLVREDWDWITELGDPLSAPAGGLQSKNVLAGRDKARFTARWKQAGFQARVVRSSKKGDKEKLWKRTRQPDRLEVEDEEVSASRRGREGAEDGDDEDDEEEEIGEDGEPVQRRRNPDDLDPMIKVVAQRGAKKQSTKAAAAGKKSPAAADKKKAAAAPKKPCVKK